MTEDQNENEPKIVVDEDWKTQVEREKQELENEPEPQTPDDMPELPPASFSILVSTLSTQALASLGFIPDPMTGKPSQNKSMAKHFIDTLAVLEEKTAGNLSEDEAELLKQTLHQLRMAFISAPDLADIGNEDSEPPPSSIELP